MPGIKVSVDLSQTRLASGIINAAVFPLINQAVRAIAQQTAINWQHGVYSAKLWSGEKDAYAQSIKWKMTSDFAAIVESDYKNAEEIETGRPARDLKQMLNTSMKVRRTKAGKRFLIIPFRHNTPGNDAHAPSMPTSVYQLASQMVPSAVTGQGMRPSGELTSIHPVWGTRALARQTPFASNPKTRSAYLVPKNRYRWGDKLDVSGIDGLSATQKRNLQGMYRFDTTSPSGAKSSAYLTFRVMMEGSTGWIVPPQPGQHIAQKVSDEMQPLAEAALGEAVRRTLGG